MIPVRADGSKAPAVASWKAYQTRRPTEQELRQWFGKAAGNGIGVVHGAVSGGSEVLDFDKIGAYEEWLQLCDDHGFGDLARGLLCVETPSGGRHVYYRHEGEPEGNRKLAWYAAPVESPAAEALTEDERRAKGYRKDPQTGGWHTVHVKIETRGEGGYTVAPGSPAGCHESGREYRRLAGRFSDLPVLTAEERRALLALASACGEYVDPSQFHSHSQAHRSPQSKPRRSEAGHAPGNRPGDAYNEEQAACMGAGVLSLLLRHGWREAGRRGDVIDLTRPGKDTRRGISATLNAIGPGAFYPFSSSAPPFEPSQGYAPFTVYALLEAGGDFAEAARRLGAQGYGDQHRPSVTINSGMMGRKRGRPRKEQPVEEATTEGEDSGDQEAEDTGRVSAGQLLVAFAHEQCELWQTPKGQTYATLTRGNHREHWPVESTGFRRFLANRYFDETGKPAPPSAIQAAVTTLDAQAARGETREVYTRKADVGGALYLDLCDDQWRAVKVTAAGWEVIDNPPVCFRRTKGMQPLPVPVKGGAIGELRTFVNAPPEGEGEDLFVLMVAWLLAALGPHQSYPILNLMGEQGTAKTWTARNLRSLVDPASPDLRREPKEDRDLAIAATNAFLVAFDNLSGLPVWLSDTLCCLSTGGGFGTRKLHTDDDEALFEFRCPVLLTGIGEAGTRGDFLERSLLVSLPVIPEERRRLEADLRDGFDEARPRILGALLDAVAAGLRNLPNTRLEGYPRMADFCRWVAACEPACGWGAGMFLETYRDNQASARGVALDSDRVAPLLIKFLAGRGDRYEDTPEDLLKALRDIASEEERRELPKNARALSVALKRVGPALRQEKGLDVSAKKAKGKRLVVIAKVASKGTQTGTQTGTQNSPDDSDLPLNRDAKTQKTQNIPVFSSITTEPKNRVKAEKNGEKSNSGSGVQNTAEFASFASLRPKPIHVSSAPGLAYRETALPAGDDDLEEIEI